VKDAVSAETIPVHTTQSTIKVLRWLECSNYWTNATIRIKHIHLFQGELPDNPVYWWPQKKRKEKQHNQPKYINQFIVYYSSCRCNNVVTDSLSTLYSSPIICTDMGIL
jgi:hypothetical protein